MCGAATDGKEKTLTFPSESGLKSVPLRDESVHGKTNAAPAHRPVAPHEDVNVKEERDDVAVVPDSDDESADLCGTGSDGAADARCERRAIKGN